MEKKTELALIAAKYLLDDKFKEQVNQMLWEMNNPTAPVAKGV